MKGRGVGSPRAAPYLEDTAEEGGPPREDLLNLHHRLCP